MRSLINTYVKILFVGMWKKLSIIYIYRVGVAFEIKQLSNILEYHVVELIIQLEK